MDHIVTFAPRY